MIVSIRIVYIVPIVVFLSACSMIPVFTEATFKNAKTYHLGKSFSIDGTIKTNGRPFKGLKVVLQGKPVTTFLSTQNSMISIGVPYDPKFRKVVTPVFSRAGTDRIEATIADFNGPGFPNDSIDLSISAQATSYGNGYLELTAAPMDNNAGAVTSRLGIDVLPFTQFAGAGLPLRPGWDPSHPLLPARQEVFMDMNSQEMKEIEQKSIINNINNARINLDNARINIHH